MKESLQDMFSLKGKTAIVTGGNGGIGKGIAEDLPERARISLSQRGTKRRPMTPWPKSGTISTYGPWGWSQT